MSEAFSGSLEVPSWEALTHAQGLLLGVQEGLQNDTLFDAALQTGVAVAENRAAVCTPTPEAERGPHHQEHPHVQAMETVREALLASVQGDMGSHDKRMVASGHAGALFAMTALYAQSVRSADFQNAVVIADAFRQLGA